MMSINKIAQASILLLQVLQTDSVALRGGEQVTRNAQEGTTSVPLVSFNPASDTHSWETVDDPVMGGVSVSTYTMEDSFGVWEGEVKDVPSLADPGFCILSTNDDNDETFPDARGTDSLVIVFGDDNGLDDAGLPLESFNMRAGVSHWLFGDMTYQAYLSSDNCCGRFCQVSWSDFDLSIFGLPIPGPNLSSKLDELTMVGLGTSGVNGAFSVKIKNFVATDKVLPCL